MLTDDGPVAERAGCHRLCGTASDSELSQITWGPASIAEVASNKISTFWIVFRLSLNSLSDINIFSPIISCTTFSVHLKSDAVDQCVHVADMGNTKDGCLRSSGLAKVFIAPREQCCNIMVHSMERHGADGCSVAAQPPPSFPKCEAAVVGKAQCEGSLGSALKQKSCWMGIWGLGERVGVKAV